MHVYLVNNIHSFPVASLMTGRCLLAKRVRKRLPPSASFFIIQYSVVYLSSPSSYLRLSLTVTLSSVNLTLCVLCIILQCVNNQRDAQFL